MADPLSIIASVFTILATGDFLHDVITAPKEREIVKGQLQGLKSVIEALQGRKEDSQAAGSPVLDDLFQKAGELNEKYEYRGPKNGEPGGDLALVYQTVAKLHRKLCPKERPTVWKRFAQKVTHHWAKDEFKNMLEGLGRACGNIHLILNEADEGKHRETERETEKTAIQKWLSPFSFPTRQNELCKDRCRTGDWFLKDETFQSWVLGPPRYLRCFGEAGAGKVCTWAQIRRMFASDKPTL